MLGRLQLVFLAAEIPGKTPSVPRTRYGLPGEPPVHGKGNDSQHVRDIGFAFSEQGSLQRGITLRWAREPEIL